MTAAVSRGTVRHALPRDHVLEWQASADDSRFAYGAEYAGQHTAVIWSAADTVDRLMEGER